MLQDLGSNHLPVLLTVTLSAPTNVPLPFNFQKALWNDFAFYFDSHCPYAEEYSSLSSAASHFTSLTLNVAKFSILFSCIKRHPKAWWFAEVEEAVSERCKAFAAALRSNKDRQAYIFASSVIAKAEAWQATCSSLSPKSVYFLFRCVTGFSSSSSSSPNFPNGSSPRKSALVYTRSTEIPLFCFPAKGPTEHNQKQPF